MLSLLTLDDSSGSPVTLHALTGNRSLISVNGLVGISGVRQSSRSRPNAHGSINSSRFTDGEIIDCVGEVISDVSVAAALAEFRQITAPMIQTLDVGPALMKWTEDAAGLQLQRLVKLNSPVLPTLEAAAAIVNYQAQFEAEDPRAYSQTLNTAVGTALAMAGGGLTFPLTFPFTFATSGGGTVSAAVGGNRPTPPIYRIYGQITNPQIVLLGADSTRIVLSGSVPAGDYLELDVYARTVKLNGETNYAQYVNPSRTTWKELPAGVTTNFQLIGDSFDASARLDVLTRDAYA